MVKATLRFGINIWMETDRGDLLGRGRMRLLELIQEKGSLKQAAAALGMSYRAAWGKIKESEIAWGAPLLEKQGSNRQGFQLSGKGLELLSVYRTWLEDVRGYAEKKARESFKDFFDVDPPGEESKSPEKFHHTRKRHPRC
ncbi:MAG: LysR family transcriptional regulator [Desulfovibrio sp.]|jgi:molybdate transport system regulatory protein|nr:LysR family transcriptional regulator [Desulfovibrio sp.]